MLAILGKNRDFRLLWVCQTISKGGDALETLAFLLLVLALSGNPLVMA